MFVSTEEGRARVKKDSSETVYDYMVKDHLSNVRMVLTEEKDTTFYPPATMEDAVATQEELIYGNLPATRVDEPAQYPEAHVKVAMVNGKNSANMIGPSIILKVMAGDKFNVTVDSWYSLNADLDAPNNPITELISALAGSMAAVGGKVTQSEIISSGVLTPGVTQFLNSQSGYNTSRPKAFLNWILFDEQFNYVSSNSGFEQVPDESVYNNGSYPTNNTEPITQSDMPISKNGFLYIYVNNETPSIDVFFDNLQVTHIKGPLLEETHYYPFGLTMAGISSKAAGGKENKKKFVGQELDDDFALNWYQFKWRNHDPQIGRFIEIDPLADKYAYNSTYAYAENRPIDGIDLEGLEFTRRVDGKSITLSATTQSVNKTTMVSNDYINRVNAEVNRQMGELFNKSNVQTGNNYSANYNSSIVESGNYDNTIVAEFYNNLGGKNGDNGSNTQSGRIRVGVMEDITVVDQDGNITKGSFIRKESEVATTVIHELLHGTGAQHVFAPNGNGVPADIAQYNSDGTRSNVPDETIRKNVLNSGGNTDKNLRNNDGRNNLSLGQIEAADARIKSEIDKKNKQ